MKLVVFCHKLSLIRFMIQTARIFLNVDRSTTGLKFCGGPFGLFVCCRGVKSPVFNSWGYFPVSATIFNIFAICW